MTTNGGSTNKTWRLPGNTFSTRARSLRVERRRRSDHSVGVLVVTHTDHYLLECLTSIARQTFKPKQVVVVDNCSLNIGNVESITRGFTFTHIRISEAVSPATARNIGCELLHECSFIANLDGDDIYEDTYLASYFSRALQADADVVYGPAKLFGEKEGIAFQWTRVGVRTNLRVQNLVPANSLFRRSMWKAIGGFDPSVGLLADYDFWMSSAKAGAKFAYVDSVLWRYRRHSDSQLATYTDHEKFNSHRLIREKHIRYINGVFQWRRILRGIIKVLTTFK